MNHEPSLPDNSLELPEEEPNNENVEPIPQPLGDQLAAEHIDPALTASATKLLNERASEYLGVLLKYLLAKTRDYDRAEELAQMTIIDAWTHIRKFRGTSTKDGVPLENALQSWLFGIARNLYLMEARIRQRQQQRTVALNESSQPLVEAPDGEVIDRVYLEELLKTVELNPEQRAIVQLRFIAGYPHPIIAEKLGISEVAVRTRLGRIRAAFKRAASKLAEPDDEKP